VQAFNSSVILSAHRQTNSWCGNLLRWLEKKPMYQQDIPKLDQKLDASKLLAHEKGLQLKQIGECTSTIIRTYRSLKVGYEQE